MLGIISESLSDFLILKNQKFGKHLDEILLGKASFRTKLQAALVMHYIKYFEIISLRQSELSHDYHSPSYLKYYYIKKYNSKIRLILLI